MADTFLLVSGAILRAASLLFGVGGDSIASIVADLVPGFLSTVAASGVMALVLGSAGAAGFAAKALIVVVRGLAGVVYLTVDLTARGVITASKAAWNALPKSSPPPAHWNIQENYKPAIRESYVAPAAKSLSDRPHVVLTTQDIAKIAGKADLSSSFVECSEDQLATILGQSRAPKGLGESQLASPSSPLSHPQPQQAAKGMPSQASSYNGQYASNNGAYASGSSKPSSSAPSASPHSQYPAGTVSQDALAGFLSQSARSIQQAQQANPSQTLTEEDIEELIVADSEWKPPQGVPSHGYASHKLEQSVDMHASRLRARDPIVDSWMEVSAPPADA